MSLIVNTYNCKTRDQLVVLSEIPVHADPSLIWNTLTTSQHLLRFNPFIISHEKGEVDGNGYEDCCTYENGKVLCRQVVEYEEGCKIKYRVNYADQFHNSFTCFEVVRKGEQVFFRLTLLTDAYRRVPRPIWHLVAYLVLLPSLKKYLNAVTKGMKHYCETEIEVSTNQFGSHRGFSA